MAYLQLLQTLLNLKQIVFKRCTTIKLNAQTNFNGQLKMTENKKAVVFPILAVGFEKFFYDRM